MFTYIERIRTQVKNIQSLQNNVAKSNENYCLVFNQRKKNVADDIGTESFKTFTVLVLLAGSANHAGNFYPDDF